jgi:nucleotide-binding universal stress UspA family protein
MPDDTAEEAALRTYLARHGIDGELTKLTVDVDAGHALLSLAATLGADLLVAGYHAHPQFDDVLHRGVTRTLLQEGGIATLLCQ